MVRERCLVGGQGYRRPQCDRKNRQTMHRIKTTLYFRNMTGTVSHGFGATVVIMSDRNLACTYRKAIYSRTTYLHYIVSGEA